MPDIPPEAVLCYQIQTTQHVDTYCTTAELEEKLHHDEELVTGTLILTSSKTSDQSRKNKLVTGVVKDKFNT